LSNQDIPDFNLRKTLASVVSHNNLVISTSGRYLVFSYDNYDFLLRFEMTYCIAIYDTLHLGIKPVLASGGKSFQQLCLLLLRDRSIMIIPI
jgi:hypothetical protein